MTRNEALDRATEYRAIPDFRTATGTDGRRWYRTHRDGGRDAHWTWEILWDGKRFYVAEAVTDPPGVDWVPNRVEPPEGALPVTDPEVGLPARRGLQPKPQKPGPVG